VSRCKHLVDLLFFEVVGDVLHDCRKCVLSAITVVILSMIVNVPLCEIISRQTGNPLTACD
jgi:hypothetical protein